jgi:hypothetical protein
MGEQAPKLIVDPVASDVHTCKRGHKWATPKQVSSKRYDLFTFAWVGADGNQQRCGTGTLCLQCYRDDMVAAYGPV